MAGVQVAKKELRRKIHNLLKDVPRDSVIAQCSDTFGSSTTEKIIIPLFS